MPSAEACEGPRLGENTCMAMPETPSYPPQTPTEQLPAPTRAATPAVPEAGTRKGPRWGTYFVTVVALLVLAAVIVFVFQNTQPIDIKFLSWKHHFDKTSWVLGAVAVGGLIVGLLLGLVAWNSSRRKARAARRGL
jgi:uncharacterized integral membrane protein